MFGFIPSGGTALLAALCIGVLFLFVSLYRLFSKSVVFIQNDEYGIVERRFAGGRTAEPFAPIALNGGAGFLPDVLRGGWHFLTPYKYVVHKRPLISVDPIAYLVARVGKPLAPGQVLGEWPENAGEVSDVSGFLGRGGQAGPQRRMLRTGTHAINTAMFDVVVEGRVITFDTGSQSGDASKVLDALNERFGFAPVVISQDQIGVVTVQDGPALTHGEIIAPAIGTDASDPETFHNSFQNVRAFMQAGGRRGRQEQVLVEGTYFINRLFATVEVKEKIKIAIGEVGVVNSFVGTGSSEVSPVDEGRGRVVERGQRGVCREALLPGKYAINPYAVEVIKVPTTNFVLRWIEGQSSPPPTSGTKSYDADLKEIEVITEDAFEILLPLSLVAHISPANAPHVIQRFSDVGKLVNQTLDPFASQFFRDSAQKRKLIDFIKKREEITQEAHKAMKERMGNHRIEIEEVMLGTVRGSERDKGRVEAVLEQLRLRQLAKEEEETYRGQEAAADALRSLNEKRALADQQPDITRSSLAVTVARNEGQAETERMKAAAEGILVKAEADAKASKLRAEAVGGPDNLIRLDLYKSMVEMAGYGTQFTPQVTVGGGGGENATTSALLGVMLRDLVPPAKRLNGIAPGGENGERPNGRAAS